MDQHKLRYLLVAAAAILGAAGVSLAAVAAHRVESPALATAASMLMIHAGAGIGIAGFSAKSQRPNWWSIVVAAMLASVALFSGDIAFNTLAGVHLFPMAAPTGGSLLIGSWMAVALCALAEFKGTRREP
ncbi:MAG: DUF423 domain-containing protein [Hyphomicrobium sp.]